SDRDDFCHVADVRETTPFCTGVSHEGFAAPLASSFELPASSKRLLAAQSCRLEAAIVPSVFLTPFSHACPAHACAAWRPDKCARAAALHVLPRRSAVWYRCKAFWLRPWRCGGRPELPPQAFVCARMDGSTELRRR